MVTIGANRILVVAAHPDDEVLGCGGTLARQAREGSEVYIAILGEGSTSRQRADADASGVAELQAQSLEVAGLLGVREVFHCGLPDNRFDTLPLLDVVRAVEDLIAKVSPEVIYTHHGGDLNIDHVIVNRAVLTAARPLEGQSVRDIYAFEVPSSTEWAFQRLEQPFRPNAFIDISTTIDSKIEGMEKYTGEVRPFPHPRSPEALRAIAKRWGSVVGTEYAEAFELIRSIR